MQRRGEGLYVSDNSEKDQNTVRYAIACVAAQCILGQLGLDPVDTAVDVAFGTAFALVDRLPKGVRHWIENGSRATVFESVRDVDPHSLRRLDGSVLITLSKRLLLASKSAPIAYISLVDDWMVLFERVYGSMDDQKYVPWDEKSGLDSKLTVGLDLSSR